MGILEKTMMVLIIFIYILAMVIGIQKELEFVIYALQIMLHLQTFLLNPNLGNYLSLRWKTYTNRLPLS